MPLQTLKPRIAELRASRVGVAAPISPGATPRQRGRAWMTRRDSWLSKHPLCCHCEQAGRVSLANEVDHIIPLWDGGADDETNFQSLCGPCHKTKTAGEAARRAIGGWVGTSEG